MSSLWSDPDAFVIGVNLPWFSYGHDFGSNAWEPAGGVARPDRRARLEEMFTRLAEARVQVVRWFLLCDGRAGLCDDDGGMPAGLDAYTFDDFQAALTVAEHRGVALMPVLLDFHWCHAARDVDGVRCGGRRALVADAGHRTHLLQHVLRPLLARFGSRTGIAAWDLINEPEWVTFSWGTWDPLHALLPDETCAYISEAAALVHECTDHPATVGLATAASLARVRGLGLDLYQAHWYDKLDDQAPLATPVVDYALDAPVVLGEFPTRNSARSPWEIAVTAREAGYRGAFAWSVNAADDATDVDALWRWLARPVR